MSDTRTHLRRFGLTMAVALAAFAALAAWREKVFWPVLAALAALFALLALLGPGLLAPVQRGWLAVGRVLGTVVTHVLLALTYVLLITPLGMLMRALGKGVAKGFDRDRASYWVEVEADGPAGRPDRPY